MTDNDFPYDDPFSEPARDTNPVFEDESPAEGETRVARGGPVANGKREPIPAAAPLPQWPSSDMQDAGDGAVESEIDYSDLDALNRDLLRLRSRMNRIRRQMREAGREAIEAKLNYQRAMRRALVQQSGGSAESRKAAAELMCEDLEAEMVMRQQVSDELATRFRAIRDDIENAKVVAYNLRALMNI